VRELLDSHCFHSEQIFTKPGNHWEKHFLPLMSVLHSCLSEVCAVPTESFECLCVVISLGQRTVYQKCIGRIWYCVGWTSHWDHFLSVIQLHMCGITG